MAKGKLSFGSDDEEAETKTASADLTPRDGAPDGDEPARPSPGAPSPSSSSRTGTPTYQQSHQQQRKRLGPNSANLGVAAPRALTKSALMAEARTRDSLRKEFLAMQEAVKATEIVMPFVFYDGTSVPGGACKVKKGDCVWLFLDRSRKMGADLGVGAGGGGGGGWIWGTWLFCLYGFCGFFFFREGG